MVKRRYAMIALMLCLCLCFGHLSASAISTSDASEPLLTDQKCLLTVCYKYDGKAFSEQKIKLYKIADISSELIYTLTPDFSASALIINGIKSNSEWNVVRSTLEAYILANSIEPMLIGTTDDDGQAHFRVSPGLYFCSELEAVSGFTTCAFDSALIALPGMDADGKWQYDINVSVKPTALPPIDPDEDISLKVLKLWKGDEGRTDRPTSVDVEIFRDGVSYSTITLSEENNWSYSWSVKNDGSSWSVIERNIPTGYTMTVEQRQSSFVLTNTLIPPPDTPIEPPLTGDSSNIMLYIVLMILSGSLLVVFGVTGKRKSK